MTLTAPASTIKPEGEAISSFGIPIAKSAYPSLLKSAFTCIAVAGNEGEEEDKKLVFWLFIVVLLLSVAEELVTASDALLVWTSNISKGITEKTDPKNKTTKIILLLEIFKNFC